MCIRDRVIPIILHGCPFLEDGAHIEALTIDSISFLLNESELKLTELFLKNIGLSVDIITPILLFNFIVTFSYYFSKLI